jgi:hypothetical protein
LTTEPDATVGWDPKNSVASRVLFDIRMKVSVRSEPGFGV